MVRIIILSFFISLQSIAQECPSQTVYTKTDGSKITLCYNAKHEDFISLSCLKNCGAKKFLGQSIELTTKELKGGKEPHSVACTKLSGKLYLYRDEKQNEYAFCEADDGSAVSADLIDFKIK